MSGPAPTAERPHEHSAPDPRGAGSRPLAGRTVVLITHRLASVRHADLIVVPHHGRVIETGTHHQLHAAGGRYAELYDLQARSYREDPDTPLPDTT